MKKKKIYGMLSKSSLNEVEKTFLRWKSIRHLEQEASKIKRE